MQDFWSGQKITSWAHVSRTVNPRLLEGESIQVHSYTVVTVDINRLVLKHPIIPKSFSTSMHKRNLQFEKKLHNSRESTENRFELSCGPLS